MSILRRARDLKLIDALDQLERVSIDTTLWRPIRNGRDPLLGSPSGGRWDTGQFDVIYTSYDPNGAISELHFQLLRQPVFPHSVEFALNKISVRTTASLRFADLAELEPLGVQREPYGSINYERTREIADAAYFLGFDSIVAPSARWPCLNLVVFADRIDPSNLDLHESSKIDWDTWLRSHKAR